MLEQLTSLLGLLTAALTLSVEATNVTKVKSLAIDVVGRQSHVVRSEKRHPAAVERHNVPGLEEHGAVLGEMGSSFISESSADAIGAHVVAALQLAPPKSASVAQSQDNAPDAPTLLVNGNIYLRQPAHGDGKFKTREWYCDACELVAGRGKYSGDHQGCYTVDDFICAGGEHCLMKGDECYLGRVELPKGIQVTYFSGFSGAPSSGAWDNACVGRTNRGTTSDPSFSEVKGFVPRSPAVCAMKIELMAGYSCGSSSAMDWQKCSGRSGDSVAACPSLILMVAAVVLGFS